MGLRVCRPDEAAQSRLISLQHKGIRSCTWRGAPFWWLWLWIRLARTVTVMDAAATVNMLVPQSWTDYRQRQGYAVGEPQSPGCASEDLKDSL